MQHEITLYNTRSRKKEKFVPIQAGKVGMYVCGPTVYGDAHLGHARPAITFDVVVRYLRKIGYEVTYVRNITDVGHLENDADEGEDKIAKKARQEKVDPLEIARFYTERYHRDISRLNVLPPDIEPRATDHIQEQIEITNSILSKGLAYEVNGSVYFDLDAYTKKFSYGGLSGRVIDEMRANTRDLDGQNEKRNPLDFALWKLAPKEHIMRWKSPWGDGFPGWHIECTAMSTKYLGKTFDIHGGGLDLMFPHHECEIAQSNACNDVEPAKYWMHNNMITIDGQKMSKSLGNFITLEQIYLGEHIQLENAYSPMTVRFFILQAHYRGTLDFSNTALTAAKKGFNKLINALRAGERLTISTQEGEVNAKVVEEIEQAIASCYQAMNDDFNTAIVISNLFKMAKYINMSWNNQLPVGAIPGELIQKMVSEYKTFTLDVLGLKDEMPDGLLPIIEEQLVLYTSAKSNKDYATVDAIRAEMKEIGILIRDMKTGVDWAYEE